MKVLIIGNGGREHAVGWKIKKDNPDVDLFFSPGNGGTFSLGKNINLTSKEDIVLFAKENKIDLTFVGPEALLVDGIVDDFKSNGLRIFGHDKKASMLEGSKDFAKRFMLKYGVKTAKFETFNNYTQALDYAKNQKYPLVIKADGLASGKGVVICRDKFQAEEALDNILNKKKFAEAGSHVVIEEFLEGFETSILSVYNGNDINYFISAKDHKKIGEGEKGLNTGGMGVIAPNPLFSSEYLEEFKKDILEPTFRGLKKEEMNCAGIIFFGLMINSNGVFLLEYNMRMGDPETQALLPLMENNFLSLINNAIDGKTEQLRWKNQSSVCVVIASGGYPENYDIGFEIRNFENLDCPIFVAGATIRENKLYTSGGRVLNVVGIGDNLDKAIEIAYKNVSKVRFDYNYYRKDIGVI